MKRVLIVEDEYVTAELFRHVVANRLKHEVVAVAYSGEEALARVRELNPEVVFMDIKMEEEYAGIEACKRIKEERPQTKVFLLTAYSRHVLKEKLDNVPCDGYIDKLNFSDIVKDLMENL
jgi:CheY-like chemotaxis protein